VTVTVRDIWPGQGGWVAESVCSGGRGGAGSPSQRHTTIVLPFDSIFNHTLVIIHSSHSLSLGFAFVLVSEFWDFFFFF
jgi:hypothetical protein